MVYILFIEIHTSALIIRYHYPSLWWENEGSKRLNNLPKVTKLVSNRAETQARLNRPKGINYLLPNLSPAHSSVSVGSHSRHSVIQGASLFSHSIPVHPGSLLALSSKHDQHWTGSHASAAATLIAHLHFPWLPQLCSCFTFAPYCLLSALQQEWSLWNKPGPIVQSPQWLSFFFFFFS